jgi:hypothetical protein
MLPESSLWAWTRRDRRSPSKQCFKGLGQLPLSATLTALATLLAGLVTAIGILALLTRGVLATLTLIFFATVLTAALLLATLVLLAALVLCATATPSVCSSGEAMTGAVAIQQLREPRLSCGPDRSRSAARPQYAERTGSPYLMPYTDAARSRRRCCSPSTCWSWTASIIGLCRSAGDRHERPH